ncbi:DUF3244 domain-containing protein [Arundinibacter roseus]|uniref:Secretion system C-terminal sorting domain-containing protein n=1 Tax=Arundinibacter roseus TaxID=2070510 RepID=A0A4R4K590_9BACT|nr:hypothetical protein [Arundinibacter roseus]TDB61822.1 hypothetical protein EZE20_18935 [Arundinibacter roseus]
MKTSFKTLIFAFAFGTTAVSAGPGEGSKKATSFATGIYTSQDGRLNVNIEKSLPLNTTVLIMNSQGDILARENVSRKQTKACIKFDLSALQDGEYKLAVVSKVDKEVKEFVISSATAVTQRTLTFE